MWTGAIGFKLRTFPAELVDLCNVILRALVQISCYFKIQRDQGKINSKKLLNTYSSWVKISNNLLPGYPRRRTEKESKKEKWKSVLSMAGNAFECHHGWRTQTARTKITIKMSKTRKRLHNVSETRKSSTQSLESMKRNLSDRKVT